MRGRLFASISVVYPLIDATIRSSTTSMEIRCERKPEMVKRKREEEEEEKSVLNGELIWSLSDEDFY